MENTNYIVDITEPPIGPPCRTRMEGFLGSYETKESIDTRERYETYINEYRLKSEEFSRLKHSIIDKNKDIYLFLDIDGVLNTYRSMKQFGHIADFHSAIYSRRPLTIAGMNFDIDCVNQLKYMIHEFNMSVIISSTWRMGVGPVHFKELFSLYGINPKFVDTISLKEETKQKDRSLLIQDYIDNLDIVDFVCVDDTFDHYSTLRDRLVLTQISTGFTRKSYHKAIEILGKF